MNKRVKRRWCLALLAACFSVLFPAGSASAHAGLEESEPKPSSWLATSPTEVVLYFDEPVGVVFARIQILDQDGKEVFETRPTRDEDDHSTVRANIDELGEGTWVVLWRIASADSHPVQGSFAFSIGTSSSDVTSILNNDARQGHGLNNLFNIIRFVMFAGILTLLGGVAMVMFGAQKAPSIRTRMSLWGAWTFAIVASIQALFAYGPHASGVKVYNVTDLSLLSDTMTTTFGQAQTEGRHFTAGEDQQLRYRQLRRALAGRTGQGQGLLVQLDAQLHPVGQAVHPGVVFQRLPLTTQLGGALQQLRVDGQVELDRASDLDRLRARAQIAEALGFGFGLHREQAHFSEHRRGQLAEATIAPRRSLGQSTVGQRHRNPAFGTLMNVVRPQFGFQDQGQAGLEVAEEAVDAARHVVRQVDVVQRIAPQRAHPLRPGRGDGGDHPADVRALRAQRVDGGDQVLQQLQAPQGTLSKTLEFHPFTLPDFIPSDIKCNSAVAYAATMVARCACPAKNGSCCVLLFPSTTTA